MIFPKLQGNNRMLALLATPGAAQPSTYYFKS